MTDAITALLAKWNSVVTKTRAKMRQMDSEAVANDGCGDQGGYLILEIELRMALRIVRDLRNLHTKAAAREIA